MRQFSHLTICIDLNKLMTSKHLHSKLGPPLKSLFNCYHSTNWKKIKYCPCFVLENVFPAKLKSFWTSLGVTYSEWHGKRPEISRTTIHTVKKRMNVDKDVHRRAGNGCKGYVNRESLLDSLWGDPFTSMRQRARSLGVEAASARRAVKKLGSKCPVVVERTLLILEMHA